jgi:4-amino-4-deoxy-L-arabinose transferase-like glycosyltransferase
MALLLSWVVLVVAFFSASSGKRGVYVLPAVPALALVCAPWLREVVAARIPRRALLALVIGLAAIFTVAAAYLLFEPARRIEYIARHGVDFFGPLAIMGVGASIVAVWLRGRPYIAYVVLLTGLMVVMSYGVVPAINRERSSEAFVAAVEAQTQGVAELGLVGYKEQYLLEFMRPTVNFGHARWRDSEQEAADAAAWLAASPDRALLVDENVRRLCFPDATARPLQAANNKEWVLVFDNARPACVAEGQLQSARIYTPPPPP